MFQRRKSYDNPICIFNLFQRRFNVVKVIFNVGSSGVASSISEGGIFIYSCSAHLSSFEIKSISKEINCPEHEYMNMSPSLIDLATPLVGSTLKQRHFARWVPLKPVFDPELKAE